MSEPEPYGRGTRFLAAAVVALRFLILPAWIAAAVAATLFLPPLGGTAALSGLVPEDAEAIDAGRRASDLFAVPLVAHTAVVQRDPAGLSREAHERAVERALAIAEGREPIEGLLGALPIANTGRLLPSSSEDGTTAITYLFFDPDASLARQYEIAHEFAERIAAEPGDALVGVTGPAPARLEEWRAIERNLPWVTLATVGIIALLVGFHFRSPVAPLVALAAAGTAYLVSVRVVGWAGETFGLAVPREVEPVMVVLLLGIVTDYAIFFLTGLRRGLAAGDRRVEAARRATARNLPIVATAGLIVAAGTAALVAGELEFFRAFGPGLAVAALVALAVSITLIPALMGLLGRLLLWPSVPTLSAEDEEPTRGWRFRVAHAMTARPAALLIALVVAAGLGAAGLGLTRTNLGFTVVDSLPGDAEARRASEAATEGFAAGILSPTVVLVEADGLAERLPELERLELLLEREPGVAGVLGPGGEATQAVEGVTLAESGQAARFAVVLDVDPLGGPALEAVRELEERAPELLRQAGLGGATASLAGDTALADETIATMLGDLGRITAAALLVNLLLLALFLRALVAPLYLLLTSVLALAASLGLTTLLFQVVLGYDELTYYVPLAASVLLVSLGSDYNVFVVGRVWQEARLRPLREAVSVAAPRAARAITVAGVTLALGFATLAIIPLRPFREFAFCMFVGIVLETLLVRSLLVPALISMFGYSSGWPGRRLRPPAAPATHAARAR